MEKIPLSAPVRDEDLDAILSFIPRLQEIIPDKVVIESPGKVLEESGNSLVVAMHGSYHPLVEEFQQALYRHRFIRIFDWGKWIPQAKAIYEDQNRLEHASMATCIKLLTLHARNDRFVEGHFAAMLTSGHIIAVLKRMEQLGRAIPPKKDFFMHMELKYDFYESEPSTRERYPSRFANPQSIQACLRTIGEAWAAYLNHYTERTSKLFHKSECPWTSTERAIVSTISAAIMRKMPDSIVIEESRVPKLGKTSEPGSKQTSGRGRYDLWASVPNLTPDVPFFNFYLEAKKSLRPKNAKSLEKHLSGGYGISKLFRDLVKRSPEVLTQRSAYRNDKNRKHEHYVIGLLVTPLAPAEGDIEKIKMTLKSVFEKLQKIDLRAKKAGISFRNDSRHMARYPTVAVILVDREGKQPGTIASFTVLGSTNALSASGATKQKKK